MHLFFLIHGLFGKESHMDSMYLALQNELPSDCCIIYSSKCNELIATFEGVEMGALRIYTELLQVVMDNNITHLSIIGYSMGGLYARYLVGMLQDHPTFFRDVKPVNFVTFATPHLGATLWKPGLWTRCLNGLGRAFLGPSGVDLMSRGPSGTLDDLCKPSSRYMQALHSFPNLLLFCNAKGDRSVRFWTSFLTDKHPFTRRHREILDLVFFTCKGQEYEPFMVDMEASRLKAKPTSEVKKSTGVVINLIYAVVPIFFLVMGCISTYSWIKWIFYRPYLRWKCCRMAKRFSLRDSDMLLSSAEAPTMDSKHRGDQTVDKLEETVHLAAEEYPPDEDIEDSAPASKRKTSTEPKPFSGSSDLIEKSARISGFTDNMMRRLNSLNSLPWKKYVAYLDHYRTHANIIDRLHEDGTQGKELLTYFAKQVEI